MKTLETSYVILPCAKITVRASRMDGLDLFAQCKATETPQYNILAGFGDHLFHKVAHYYCLILHPGLHHQYLLTQHPLEFAVNNLITLRRWNTLHRRILQNRVTGLFNNLGRYVFEVNVLGGSTTDLQGQIISQLTETVTASNKVGAAIELQQYSQVMVVMNVGEDATLFGLTAGRHHLLSLVTTPGIENFDGLIPTFRFG